MAGLRGHKAGLPGHEGRRQRADLFDHDGEFVLQLDAVAQAVVDVEVGDLVGAGAGVAVADPAEVNLPVLVAGGFRVVGAERRSALPVRRNGQEKAANQR